MKFDRTYHLSELAQQFDFKYVGNDNHAILGINEIHRVVVGDIVFVDHPKYYDKALQSAATTIIINKEVTCPEGKALILSDTPFDLFNQITMFFMPPTKQKTLVGTNTTIAESVHVYPNAYIGSNVQIGENVIIHAGAVIHDNTQIDEGAIIGPNAVIGHYAFYYKLKPSGREQLYSCGGVWIQKNVEIGACTTIDKGVTDLTIIGEGTKIDNHVHIGHDTIIGKNCVLAAQVGIAGCVTIEDDCILWGQVGSAADVTIGKGSVILAQSGVSKDLKGGQTYFGSPCGEAREKFKEIAALHLLAKRK
ncbi:MAG TPA: LpxD N-terminal domain-containing protein [Crocinitomicaceae bacterium]|nr:LpxD N-terminal domain-containing protein [Crocinitomicaceae bacterium]